MSERTCATNGCDEPEKARGFCKRCYGTNYRRGTLPPQQLEIPFGIHAITEIDRDALTATCAVCGPGARIRIRERGNGQPACRRRKDPRAKYKVKKQQSGRRYELRKYGLTVDDYEAMRSSQKGACLICGDEPSRLVVDHCHATGAVRGLLCARCNVAIGILRDDPSLMRRAAEYLERERRPPRDHPHEPVLVGKIPGLLPD